MDGVGVHMVDNLRAMVFRLGYDKAPTYHYELWTHPWFEPHWRLQLSYTRRSPSMEIRRYLCIKMWLT
jgi:hypothetical protein